MNENQKTKKYGPVIGKFNSISRPDDVHEVRLKDGCLSCNCKAWIFSRGSVKSCRHTAFLEDDPRVKSQRVQKENFTETRELRRAQQTQNQVVFSNCFGYMAIREMEQALGYVWPVESYKRVSEILKRHFQLTASVQVAVPATSMENEPVRMITFDE